MTLAPPTKSRGDQGAGADRSLPTRNDRRSPDPRLEARLCSRQAARILSRWPDDVQALKGALALVLKACYWAYEAQSVRGDVA